MPEPLDKIFGDYARGDETTGASAEPATAETAISVDEEKWGTGKVKRVKLRAQIIRDQNGAA